MSASRKPSCKAEKAALYGEVAPLFGPHRAHAIRAHIVDPSGSRTAKDIVFSGTGGLLEAFSMDGPQNMVLLAQDMHSHFDKTQSICIVPHTSLIDGMLETLDEQDKMREEELKLGLTVSPRSLDGLRARLPPAFAYRPLYEVVPLRPNLMDLDDDNKPEYKHSNDTRGTISYQVGSDGLLYRTKAPHDVLGPIFHRTSRPPEYALSPCVVALHACHRLDILAQLNLIDTLNPRYKKLVPKLNLLVDKILVDPLGLALKALERKLSVADEVDEAPARITAGALDPDPHVSQRHDALPRPPTSSLRHTGADGDGADEDARCAAIEGCVGERAIAATDLYDEDAQDEQGEEGRSGISREEEDDLIEAARRCGDPETDPAQRRILMGLVLFNADCRAAPRRLRPPVRRLLRILVECRGRVAALLVSERRHSPPQRGFPLYAPPHAPLAPLDALHDVECFRSPSRHTHRARPPHY